MKVIDLNGNKIDYTEDMLIKAVDDKYYLLDEEETNDYNQRLLEGNNNNVAIKRQIANLEALQTPRRLREAILDPTWMNDLDEQIENLRNQLT